MSSIGNERFFRKPDLQLRDFGASVPDVSFSQIVSSSRSRHPVIVTAPEFWASGVGFDSTAATFAADSTVGAFEADSIVRAPTQSTAGVFPIIVFAARALAVTSAAGAFDATGFVVSSRTAAANSSGCVARVVTSAG